MNRGLKVDARCQVCGFEEESINHVIFNCSLARQTWALSDYPAPARGMEEGTVFSNIFHLLKNVSNPLWPANLRKSFPWIIWRIWKNRNLFAFEGRLIDPRVLVENIRKDVEDWFFAKDLVEEEKSLLGRRVCVDSTGARAGPLSVWIAPPSLWVKCNVGFSWSKRNKLRVVAGL